MRGRASARVIQFAIELYSSAAAFLAASLISLGIRILLSSLMVASSDGAGLGSVRTHSDEVASPESQRKCSAFNRRDLLQRIAAREACPPAPRSDGQAPQPSRWHKASASP